MEARELARLQEQVEAVGLTERHVRCEQRLTYLASAVRKRKTCGRAGGGDQPLQPVFSGGRTVSRGSRLCQWSPVQC